MKFFNVFKRKSKFEKFYDKNREFILYSLVSLVCTVILYLLYYVITLVSGKYILGNFIAYFVSFTLLFILDQKIFKSRPLRKSKRFNQIILFIVFRVIGFMIDSAILVLLIEEFSMSSMLAKILSSLITFMYNYITNKLFVFKKSKLL